MTEAQWHIIAVLAAVWVAYLVIGAAWRWAHSRRGRRKLWRAFVWMLTLRWLTGPIGWLWRHRPSRRRASSPVVLAKASVPTLLYRHYDARDRLLYVGITHRGQRRWEEHDADKPWFAQVATSRVETFESRPAALYAEAVAIQNENPVHNIQRPDPAALRRRIA